MRESDDAAMADAGITAALAYRTDTDPWHGLAPEELLDALERMAGVAERTRAERDLLIRRCREAGLSAQRVADAAGVSKAQAWRIGRAEA